MANINVRVVHSVDYMNLLGSNGVSALDAISNIGPSNDRYRFALIGNDLIIGDISSHINLVVLWCLGLTKEMIALYSKEATRDDDQKVNDLVKDLIISAAGIIKAGTGNVYHWISDGLRVETPEELRPEIQRLISSIIPAAGWADKDWPR